MASDTGCACGDIKQQGACNGTAYIFLQQIDSLTLQHHVYTFNIALSDITNEIEVMEFTIDGSLYGINVAKVKEILVSEPVKPMPHAHHAVEGIFKPRDMVLTVVDLPKYLTRVEGVKNPKDLFIITEFNKMNIAFRVHTVVGISRISWRDIQKPDKTVSGGE